MTQQNLTNLLRYAGEILKISDRVIAERFSLNSDQSEWLPSTRGTHSHQVP